MIFNFGTNLINFYWTKPRSRYWPKRSRAATFRAWLTRPEPTDWTAGL